MTESINFEDLIQASRRYECEDGTRIPYHQRYPPVDARHPVRANAINDKSMPSRFSNL